MANIQNRIKHRQAPGWLYAVLIALLFNVGIAFLFRAEIPVQTIGIAENNEPECLIIGTDAAVSEMERSINAYAFIADPTIFAMPHPDIGFMCALADMKERAFYDLPDYQFKIEPSGGGKAFFHDKPISLPVFNTQKLNEWQQQILIQPRLQQHVLERKIIWRMADGNQLDLNPRLSESEYTIVAEAKGVQSPTILSVYRMSSDLPRVVVEQSSGVPQLDQIAARTVGRWFFTTRMKIANDDRIETEWRLVTKP